MTDGLMQDVRFALRQLAKNPGFAAVAMLSLGIGLGANTAIFSLVNALFFVPLPAADRERLVAVYTSDFSGPRFSASSHPDFLDFGEKTSVFESLAAYSPQPFALATGAEPARIWGELVSGDYFGLLGVRAEAGRTLGPADEDPAATPALVISRGLWQRRFGGDASVLGRSVTLSGVPFTVVGVAAEGFSGLTRGLAADLWVPLRLRSRLSAAGERPLARGSRFLSILGRLKPGLSLTEAQLQLDVLAGQLKASYPDQWTDAKGETRRVSLLPESGARLLPDAQSAAAAFSALLALVVALVLLIACANVANLMLARAASRRREVAVRISLGASRARLMRQFLVEGVLVAALGGVLGAQLAFWAGDALSALRLPLPVPLHLNVQPDARVLGFGLALTLLTGLLLGLAPALQASRPDLQPVLKDEGSGIRGGQRGHRLRRIFVATQVALTLVLLAGASLLLRGLERAASLRPGFDPEGVALLGVDLGLAGYDEARTAALIGALAERTPGSQGIAAASLAWSLPLDPLLSARRGTGVDGYEPRPGEDMELHFGVVGPGFFEALRIPVVRGRGFTKDDRVGAAGVVIVNEAFAQRFWPGQDPLQRTIRIEGADGPRLTVVGVARDSRYLSLSEDRLPYYYLPLLQDFRYVREMGEFAPVTVLVRAEGDPLAAATRLAAELHSLDARLPVYAPRTMLDHLGLSVLPSRIAGTLFGGFGLLGIALASLGLYAIVAHAASQRTQEIGVRIALGASRSDVLRLVVGDGMRLVGVGLAAGLLLSAGLSQAMRSLLYGLPVLDPVTFAGAPLLLGTVALAASALPARRAARLDPAAALRCE